MMWFADTSFLCALYRRELWTCQAIGLCEKHRGQIAISSLVAFEFRQSIRLQIRQHLSDKTTGISKEDAARVLAAFQRDVQSEVYKLIMPVWSEVHILAEIVSAKYTETEGHRFADILHVDTALQLGCTGLLTFDDGQRLLAKHEGLDIPVR